MNLEHKELIIEILEKVDSTIIQRFKEISKQIREYDKEAENFVMAKKNINEKIGVLRLEQEKLIGRVFFNKTIEEKN